MTAFWWIPYFFESPTMAIPDLVKLSKTALPLSSLVTRTISNGSPRYLGNVLLLLACGGILFGDRRKSAALCGIASAGLLMFIGPSLPFYDKIPVLGLVFSERAIPTIAVSLTGLAGLGLSKATSKLDRLIPEASGELWLNGALFLLKTNFIPLAITAISALAMLMDSSFILPSSKAKPIPSDFAKLAQFLAKQPKHYGARVAFAPSQALESYSPVLTGWPILGGYFVQGSQISTEIEWVMSKELLGNDRRIALAALKRWGVEYVAVNKYSKPKTAAALEKEKFFTEVYSNNNYSLYRYSLAQSYIVPVQSVLVMGDPRYIRETLEKSAGAPDSQIIFSEGGMEELKEGHFDIIIFTGGNLPEGFEEEIERRLKVGTLAIIDLDGASLTSFLGVKVRPVQFKGPLTISNQREDTHVVDATYMGGPWDTIYFENPEETWLYTGKKSLAALKRIGKGKVLLLGFNPFYHAAYKQDEWEKRELERMFQRLTKRNSRSISFSYRPLRVSPGSKLFELSSSSKTSLLISSGWSPYWKAYLDGQPIDIKKAQNLMLVSVPGGRHRLLLRLESWSPVKVAASAISFITLSCFTVGTYLISRK